MLCRRHPWSPLLRNRSLPSTTIYSSSRPLLKSQYGTSLANRSSQFLGCPVLHHQNQLLTIHTRSITTSVKGVAETNGEEEGEEEEEEEDLDGVAARLKHPLPEFAALGIRKSLRVALHEAFPSIQTPTACQKEYIPAILNGKDVILKDRTGTGKTMGIILALMSQPRATRPRMSYRERERLAKRPITSLVVVPHRDLAYQLMQWIRILCPHNSQASVDSIGQACVRGDHMWTLDQQILKLREQAPHILIGTPQALLDIMEKGKGVLQIPTLKTVVVDEADYQLPVPRPKASEKKWMHWERHPPPALTLLNALFEGRSKKNRGDKATASRFPLQAVFSSATLEQQTKSFLFKSPWLAAASETVRVDYSKANIIGEIKHHVLTVTPDGRMRDSRIIRESKNPSWRDTYVKAKPSTPAAPVLSPHLLEGIATTFALIVPRFALLILPATSAVKTVVAELQALGVNARGLGLQDEDRGKAELLQSSLKKFSTGVRPHTSDDEVVPDLLVATQPSIRGLDFPELTHVFMAGAPEDPEEYLHASGRVGRFGRAGKVVVFLETKHEKKAEGVFKRLDIILTESEDNLV
ncbi:hypothetical protein M422DRAFT_257010 [Sphaerobolus stellatus SS14]|uniref:RNA helicase n=1 Tax=Sphaerobolus stellatus (strain SS14) TaxID=990650 RepID=A0A0C9VFF2_SPHS4|nr:hypothetical protein M422DRAFT_257010 [Sphaerobolus stellatus SS14]